MEKSLESRLKEIENLENVSGCMISDQQGLCLAASPHIKGELSGLISAIAKQAAKIEPGKDDNPVILLEADHRQCLIHQDGGVTTAIFKKIQPVLQ